ncbi:MAG: hypothetical protein MI741_07390, partial [Rhodospirillales bacterium]|nr:hypothetical protein [Rhodospirillales bacterium]
MLLRAKEMDQELARLAASASRAGASTALPDLQAVILLAGAVRTSVFRRSIDRFILDLPIEPTLSIFDGWQIQLTHLARFLGRSELAVRVMVDSAAPEP